jgi:hypothetical protein
VEDWKWSVYKCAAVSAVCSPDVSEKHLSTAYRVVCKPGTETENDVFIRVTTAMEYHSSFWLILTGRLLGIFVNMVDEAKTSSETSQNTRMQSITSEDAVGTVLHHRHENILSHTQRSHRRSPRQMDSQIQIEMLFTYQLWRKCRCCEIWYCCVTDFRTQYLVQIHTIIPSK